MESRRRSKGWVHDRPSFPTGRITSIETQARDPERANVFVDGKFGFGVDWSLIAEHRLVREMVITPSLARELQQANERKRANSIAIAFLSHRDRTRNEIEDKLRSKDVSSNVVESVLSRLEELGYINDGRYAVAYARSRYKSKGYGPRRIQQELTARGISRGLAEASVEEVFEQLEDPLDSIREKAKRKWEKLLQSESEPRKRSKKMGDFLLRRGFSFDDICGLLEEFQRPSEE